MHGKSFSVVLKFDFGLWLYLSWIFAIGKKWYKFSDLSCKKMKTKRSRKGYSEEESDEPAQSWPQIKSDSDMFESSDEEVSKKSKKRRKKRESSSESESDASDKEAHKKRKHKKKKRKHSKKKRKDASSDDSESDSDASSDESEEDSPVVVKKRHKHKHRHPGKHSKKRRNDSDRDVYPGLYSDSRNMHRFINKQSCLFYERFIRPIGGRVTLSVVYLE